MDESDLRRLDLNLVLALHALLVERSVSGAARRLDLTQPALSKSLLKLRRHFDDDLLRRRGRTSELTPLAATMLPDVEDLVARLSTVLAPRVRFDPAVTGRRFTLAVSDYLAVVMGGELVAALERCAPGVSLDLVPLGGTAPHVHLRSVDGAVLPPGVDDDLRDGTPLLTDRWCMVVDASQAEAARGWTIDDLAGRTVVATSIGDTVPGRDLLQRIGVDVGVRFTTSTFGAVPFIVAGTTTVGLAGRRLAERVSEATGVVVLDLPAPVPEVHYHLFVDPRRAEDPATGWFLGLVASVAASLDAQPRPRA